MSKITKELQDTVAASERIEKVYFNKKGEHFFHLPKPIDVHKIVDNIYAEKTANVVQALPGAKFEFRRLKGIANEPTKRVPIIFEVPTKVYTREEVLSAKVVDEAPKDPKELAKLSSKLESAKAELDARAAELEAKELELMEKQEAIENASKAADTSKK